METAIKTGIKASELRIGNYLHTHTFRLKQTIQPRIVVVDELKHLKADVAYLQEGHRTMNTTHLFYRELSGIPLSPKLLEQYGFKHTGLDEYASAGFGYKLGGLLYFKHNGTVLSTDILYLHQLQNIYFSLLHTELATPR